MTATVLALALVAAAPADDKKADETTKAEMKKMEGNWTFEKIVTAEGNERPADELKAMTLEVKDDTRVVKRDGKPLVKSTFKIDPKASPKTIDVSVVEGPEETKGKTLYGVYELDGDTFKICLSVEGKDRPKKVESGEGVVLQVFKRVKEEKKK